MGVHHIINTKKNAKKIRKRLVEQMTTRTYHAPIVLVRLVHELGADPLRHKKESK